MTARMRSWCESPHAAAIIVQRTRAEDWRSLFLASPCVHRVNLAISGHPPDPGVLSMAAEPLQISRARRCSIGLLRLQGTPHTRRLSDYQPSRSTGDPMGETERESRLPWTVSLRWNEWVCICRMPTEDAVVTPLERTEKRMSKATSM